MLGEASTQSDGLLAAAPAMVGSVIGIALIALRPGLVDRGVALIGGAFIVGVAALAVLLEVLLVLLDQGLVIAVSVPLLLGLGAVSGGSAVAIGVTGASNLRTLSGAADQQAKLIRARLIKQCTPPLGAATICAFIALLVIAVH